MDIATLRGQIAQLEMTLKLPNLPADEAALHRATIRRIKEKIQAAQSGAADSTGATQPQQANKPQPGATQPIVVYDRPSETPPPATPPLKKPQAKPVIDADDMPEITVEAPAMPGGARRAKIVWQDDDRTQEYLTEGEARSRFTSYLRDCAEGKRAQQGRWADVTQTISFYRLCTYYQVLAAFWGAPPTAQQLEIAPLRGTREKVFSLISPA